MNSGGFLNGRRHLIEKSNVKRKLPVTDEVHDQLFIYKLVKDDVLEKRVINSTRVFEVILTNFSLVKPIPENIAAKLRVRLTNSGIRYFFTLGFDKKHRAGWSYKFLDALANFYLHTEENPQVVKDWEDFTNKILPDEADLRDYNKKTSLLLERELILRKSEYSNEVSEYIEKLFSGKVLSEGKKKQELLMMDLLEVKRVGAFELVRNNLASFSFYITVHHRPQNLVEITTSFLSFLRNIVTNISYFDIGIIGWREEDINELFHLISSLNGKIDELSVGIKSPRPIMNDVIQMLPKISSKVTITVHNSCLNYKEELEKLRCFDTNKMNSATLQLRLVWYLGARTLHCVEATCLLKKGKPIDFYTFESII